MEFVVMFSVRNRECFFYSLKKAVPNPEAKWKAGGAEGSLRGPMGLRETPAHIFEGKNFKIKEVLLNRRSSTSLMV